jgi:hypothetical protein
MIERHESPGAARCWRLLLAGVVVWAAVLAVPALAAELEITGVRVGFAGRYTLGYWTPVEVTVRAGDQPTLVDLALVVPDGDGVLSRVHDESGPWQFSAGQEQSRIAFVKFGQAKDELRIELVDGAGNVTRRALRQGSDQLAAPLAPGEELFVMVGARASGAEGAATSRDTDWRAELARVADVEQLPTQWYGYEGVERVILISGKPEIYRQLSGQRLEALRRWVQLGGRLVLAVGAAGEELLGPDGPLASFAPGKFAEKIPLRQTSALETFAGTTERLDRMTDRNAFRLDVPKLVDVRGRIEAYEGNHPRDLPLVVRTPVGLGEVLFVAVDLEEPLFTKWRGRGALIDRLLDRPESAEETGGSGGPLRHVTELGYTDLAGQLHLALSQFSDVQLIPFAAVAALLAIYIVAIGPLDYWFLKKIGRMELTWVTFPALVLIFSGGTLALAHWLKGSELRINQVDLVDLDTESGIVRGTSWSTFYSPKIDTFDLALRTDPTEVSPKESPRVLLSWLAVPGSGLSGAGRAAGSAMFTHPYDFSPRLDTIERLPIAQWSTRSLLGRWWGEASSPVTANLSDRDHLLAGTLTLPAVWPLTDCVLVYDRWAYPLATRVGGDTIDIDKELDPQTVETYFRHLTRFDEKSSRGSYDRSSTDLVRILETMMFHDAIGGELFTRLSSESQAYVDLSDQVRLGRAVLVGRSAEPATALLRRDEKPTDKDAAAGSKTDGSHPAGSELVDPAGQRVTFYRFVLPVKLAE